MTPFQIFFLIFGCITSAYAICNEDIVGELSYKLSGSNIAFPCESTKNIYLSTGRYIQRNVIATRMQIYKDKAIVAMPRYKPGVPITLGVFSLRNKDCRPTILPFPCWSFQEEGNCEALQSAIDLVLDKNELVWVLDAGIVNTLVQPVRRCAPKLVGIDVKTGHVVKVINLSQFVTAASRLQYLQIEYDCDGRAFAYISDAGIGAIIVYDIFGNKGFRVVLPRAVLAGCACKDILYIALIRNPNGNLLYFTYLSSTRLFYIKTSFLQRGQASGAVVDVGPKPPGKQMIPLGTDHGAALIFRFKGEFDIFIWNTVSCFKPDNFLLVQKGDDCRLATQVVPGYKRLMWVIESNFQDYIANTAGCLGPSIVVHPLIKTCD